MRLPCPLRAPCVQIFVASCTKWGYKSTAVHELGFLSCLVEFCGTDVSHVPSQGMAMSNSREHLIMVLRTERTRKKQSRVEELVHAGKCLGTKRNGCKCEEKTSRRGLCWSCYRLFLTQARSLSPEMAAAYEARLITAGALLADREIERIRDLSVFKRLA